MTPPGQGAAKITPNPSLERAIRLRCPYGNSNQSQA